MKRFWHRATVAAQHGVYRVLLDGKPVRLPNGPELQLRSGRLADAIAEQWGKAGGEYGGDFSLEQVSLTRLAGTAQAHVAPDPASSVKTIAAYAETDLLCYRAETPPALVRRQAEAWDRWLAWAERRYGAKLHTTTGITHIPQSPAALAALRKAVTAQNPFVLAGLGIIVASLGSLVLGLAILDGELSAEEAHLLSVSDEHHQETLWGIDPDTVSRRRAVAADVAEASRFIALSRA